MKLLIVSATEFECKAIKDAYQQGLFQSPYEISFLTTGVGLVNTSYALTKYLQGVKPNLIMNIGLAGSFWPDIKKGDVVEVESDLFADIGAEDDEFFLDLEELNLHDPNQFPFRKNKIFAEHTLQTKLKKVSGISVNKVHGNEKSIKKIIEKYNPQIESMEGAAFFYVCRCEQIPCIQIRSISNFVEKRDKSKWDIILALGNLSDAVIQILKHQNK